MLGQAKGKGWSKEEFFSVFTEDYIAQVFTIKDPDTMGTPAEILQFYKDNWDDCRQSTNSGRSLALATVKALA